MLPSNAPVERSTQRRRYIPPSQVLEWRALLELYHDRRVEHTGWAQRIHATCFHQGSTTLGEAGVVRGSRERLKFIVEDQHSPVGRLEVNTALSVMDVLAEYLDRLRRRLVSTARHVQGARALIDAIYGVGPMTSSALCAWLGGANRFSSRRAVRFAGLDITVHSSDSKRSPGRLSRPGPEVLRWLLFEAAKTSAHSCAPGHSYYSDVRPTGPRCLRPGASCARPYTSSPPSARTRSRSSSKRHRPQWSLGDRGREMWEADGTHRRDGVIAAAGSGNALVRPAPPRGSPAPRTA